MLTADDRRAIEQIVEAAVTKAIGPLLARLDAARGRTTDAERITALEARIEELERLTGRG
jgi:hypothetical protein